MFANLSSRLRQVVDKVRGRGRLSEENLREIVREVRMALLEADVALPVVRGFIERVQERAIGQEVSASLNPGQAFVRIVNDELIVALGGTAVELNLRHQPPVVILLAGLQGAGKTTTAAKLARFLALRKGRKPMLVSLDTRRPAAMQQLQQLAQRIEVPFVPFTEGELPLQIAARALAEARRTQADVLILDTAGRNRLEADLLEELRALQQQTGPAEVLFVVDSMAGQDAVNAARAFADVLPLTGVILTKTDGDARGGAALSVKEITGSPIKFIGTGEAVEELEVFHPDRMAARILGMGDVLTLVEEVEQKVDRDKAEKLARKLKQGKGFDLADLREQLQQMLAMGDMKGLLEKLPLPGKVDPAALAKGLDTGSLRRQVALINSMTPGERRFPKVINGPRKRRIAAGAGLQVQEVNRLLKQHMQMEKVMKRMSKGGLKNMLRGGNPFAR